MKKSTIKLLIINFGLLLSLFLIIFVFNIRNLYIYTLVIALFLLLLKFCLGFNKNRCYMKKQSIQNVFAVTLLMQVILFVTGLFFGYLRSSYSFRLIIIFKNIFPVLISVVAVEALRYGIIDKARENKILIVISSIIFFLVEIFLQAPYYNFNAISKIIEFLLLVAVPMLTKTVFLTYNAYYFGYESNIVYHAMFEIVVYLMPLVPDLGDYLNAIIMFILPIIMLFIQSGLVKQMEYKRDEIPTFNSLEKSISIAVCLILLAMIMLVSGLFPYFILAIGSGSMEKNIMMGDAVIVKKIKKSDYDKLDVGQVLVFRKDNKVVVHRIYSIDRDNNDIKIITKGDNNKNIDNWIVEKKDIVGKVNFKIPYIGLPTVWLSNKINS